MACMTAVTGLWLNIIYSVALGSPIIDGIISWFKNVYLSSVVLAELQAQVSGPFTRGQRILHVIQNIVDSGVFGALWRGVTLGS